MSIMDELKKLTRPYDDDSTLMDDDMDLDDDMNLMDEPVYARPTAAPQGQPAAAPVETPINMGGMGNMGSMGGNVGNMNTVNEPVRTPMSGMNIGIAPDITKYRVVLVHPERFDSVNAIADNIRKGNAVILNCEATEKDVARRVVDFLSGCAYALDGKISKAANNVYILTPNTVGVDQAEDEE